MFFSSFFIKKEKERIRRCEVVESKQTYWCVVLLRELVEQKENKHMSRIDKANAKAKASTYIAYHHGARERQIEDEQKTQQPKHYCAYK